MQHIELHFPPIFLKLPVKCMFFYKNKRGVCQYAQAALVTCGLFICDFLYMQLKNGLYPGTYPLIDGNTRSFYIIIYYIQAYFWSPYLLHIQVTRSTCI